MVPSGRCRVLLALLACALVHACDDAPPAREKSAPAGESPSRAVKGSNLPPDMVAAVSASRSSLIIGVHFALRAQPAVGQPLPVDIAILPHQQFASMRAHFDGPDGLEVSSGREMPVQSTVNAEKLLSHRLVLTPSRDGVFMVTAAVETESEEGTITRIYSIPVIVTGSVAAPAG
jgi:hypothetical protein